MNLEQLKQQLEAGQITQEQYDAAVKELENNTQQQTKSITEDDIQKMIQSATDKVRTEYSQKLKDLSTQYDTLKNEKLTDEEKLTLKEQQLAEQTRAFEQQKLDFEFVNHLSEAKLPAKLNSFIPGSDIEKKKENLTSLMEMINEFVEVKVKEKFGSQSHNPEKGGEKKYDFGKMTIDEKIRLAEEDFGLYNQLKSQFESN